MHKLICFLLHLFFIIKINFLKTSNYDVCYITNNRIFRIFSFHFCPGPGFRRSTAQILTIGVSTTYCLTAVLFLSISSEMKMMICLVLFLSGPAICALSLLRSWANNRMMIQPTVYRALWSSRVACPWGLLGRAVGVCICSIWNKLQLRLGARTKSLVPPAEYERMRKCLCACVWTCASFLLLLLLFGLC